MIYRLLADLSAALHLLFILFAGFGALAVLARPRLAWLQAPAALWGGTIVITRGTCPLTHAENHFRRLAGGEGYETGFIDHYLLPLIYPELLFPQGIPDSFFTVLGVTVLVCNALVYCFLFRKARRRTNKDCRREWQGMKKPGR
jgi:hypothetical protein